MNLSDREKNLLAAEYLRQGKYKAAAAVLSTTSKQNQFDFKKRVTRGK